MLVCQDRRFLGILTAHNFVQWQIFKGTLALPSFHVIVGPQLVCPYLGKHGVTHIVPTQSTQQSNQQENNSSVDSLLVCTSLPYSLYVRIFNTNVKPVLIYGCETWKTTHVKLLAYYKLFRAILTDERLKRILFIDS